VPTTLAAQGRRREAERLDEEINRPADRPAWLNHFYRAWLLGTAVPPARLYSEASQAAEQDIELAAPLAADLALSGDVEHATVLARRLPPHTSDRELAEAALAWRAGDIAGARNRLRALDALDPVPEWALAPSFLLAELSSAAGDDAATLEAVRRFRSVWAHLGGRGGWTMPRALLLEARALVRLGRGEAARAALDRLLAERSGADEGDALLSEAKVLRASLQAAGPAR
jgi:hypothetical protein